MQENMTNAQTSLSLVNYDIRFTIHDLSLISALIL